MAVSANQLITAQSPGDRVSFPVAASKRPYQGALAFLASGYLTDVIAAGANAFAGVVVDEVDNSSGSAGDKRCECYTEGVFELLGSGFSQGSVGAKVYASDNYTLTLTATNMTPVGRIVEFISATRVAVKIDVQQM